MWGEVEVVVLGVVGNEYEHFLACHCGVFEDLTLTLTLTLTNAVDLCDAVFKFLFPNNFLEMVCVVLHFWRTHHVALKIVGVGAGGIVHLAHYDIVREAGDDGVGAG